MGVPAGADIEQRAAVRHAAVDEGEQYLVALRGEDEGDLALFAPCDDQLARGINRHDTAFHAVLGAETFRALSWRIGERVIAPSKFEGGAFGEVHHAGGEPFAAQVRVGDPVPAPLDRARQQALDLQRGRLDQRAIGVELRQVGHAIFLSAWEIAGQVLFRA